MSGFTEPEIDWSQDQMIEVKLNEPDDFLKVRVSLTFKKSQIQCL